MTFAKQMPYYGPDSDRGTDETAWGDYVIGAAVLSPESNVLVVTERIIVQTPASEYAVKDRGGKGIKTSNISSAKSGQLAGIVATEGDEDPHGDDRSRGCNPLQYC